MQRKSEAVPATRHSPWEVHRVDFLSGNPRDTSEEEIAQLYKSLL